MEDTSSRLKALTYKASNQTKLTKRNINHETLFVHLTSKDVLVFPLSSTDQEDDPRQYAEERMT